MSYIFWIRDVSAAIQTLKLPLPTASSLPKFSRKTNDDFGKRLKVDLKGDST